MTRLHPLLQALLDRRSEMSEREYEAERQRILEEEIGIGVSAPIAPAPKIAAVAPIISAAELKRQEEARLAELVARNKGKLSSFVPSDKPKEKYIPRSASVLENGVIVHRILSDAEHKAIVEAERKAAIAALPKPASDPTIMSGATTAILHGFEVKSGIIRPITAAPKAPDPKVEDIRARWKAGEFGTFGSPEALAMAQKLIKEAQTERPVGGRIDCSVCKGAAAKDKIIGKLCRCGGKGFLAVDVDAACKIAAMGCGAADPLPESPDSLSYTAYLTDGRKATMHAESGKKAIHGACASLRASATGFERVTLDSGCMLVLRSYQASCPGCHGTMLNDGRTCTQCENGRIIRHGGRFFFSDKLVKEGESERMVPAAELADEAGRDAMSGFDPDRVCGKEKCKGHHGAIQNLLARYHANEIDELDLIPRILAVRIGKDGCYACRDAMLGGYQFAGFIRCSGPCKGSGKVNGEKCEKCGGKGYFRTTEFAWLPEGSSYAVTNEIRRVDLLAEDRIPKRDRNLTITVGEDTIEVGAGKVPSRKSGSVCSVTGTRRNAYDSAEKLYGNQKVNVRKGANGQVSRSWSHTATQGVSTAPRVKEYKATFSGG